MESNKSISPLVSDLSSSKTSVIILNQIMNLSVCIVADASLPAVCRDVLAGVAASVSFVVEKINNSGLHG